MTRYPIALRISFEGGTGVTRSVSREEVRFVTDHPPVVGQTIEGTLCPPSADDGLLTRLCYTARVMAIRRPDGGVWEVEARFERLGFTIPEAV